MTPPRGQPTWAKHPGAAIAARVVAFIVIAVGLLTIASATRVCGKAAPPRARDAGPPPPTAPPLGR